MNIIHYMKVLTNELTVNDHTGSHYEFAKILLVNNNNIKFQINCKNIDGKYSPDNSINIFFGRDIRFSFHILKNNTISGTVWQKINKNLNYYLPSRLENNMTNEVENIIRRFC